MNEYIPFNFNQNKENEINLKKIYLFNEIIRISIDRQNYYMFTVDFVVFIREEINSDSG